jgi:hypothetical protein
VTVGTRAYHVSTLPAGSGERDIDG